MHESQEDWQPTASWDSLRRRAELLARVRDFFARRGVLEVETPLLANATVSDPHLASLSCRYRGPAAPEGRLLYLQTSPEYAMKRLLATGGGPIYQISKAFRDQEDGRHHNPEFTLLEWYRPGYDHHALMDEMDELLHHLLTTPAAERLSYQRVFSHYLGLDPHTAASEELRSRARQGDLGRLPDLASQDRDGWLQLLMSHAVEPHLGFDRPTFVYDYPASQAALARVRAGAPAVAERFEVFVQGVELANGFHELVDPGEQRRRFQADLDSRRRLGLPAVPLDRRLLAAMDAGLPACAGVALGIDRLVMVALGAETLAEVMAFPVARA